jgi:protein-S-isoprenylcysteine O-methyltransferase Ste14
VPGRQPLSLYDPESSAMPMIEEFEVAGKWLFRWRSYLPLVLIVAVIASIDHFSYPYQSHFLDELWEVGCLLIGLFGLTIRALTAGFVPRNTSGRNTVHQVADTLNTTGMYSIVRNPLYLGNFFMWLAISLFLRVWWVPLIYILSFALFYERIIFTEEMFLRRKFGDEYLAWASRTPAFFPRFSQWCKPELKFSFRVVLRREYQSFYAMIAAFFLLEQGLDLYLGNGLHIDPMWIYIMAFSTCFYGAMRILHRKTPLLRVEGR